MKLEETENTLPAEKEWWEQRRQAIELELLGGPPAGAPVVAGVAKAPAHSAAPGSEVATGEPGIVDATNKEKKAPGTTKK